MSNLQAKTLTMARPHGISIGSRVLIGASEPDKRWWMRAWHALTRRGAPMRQVVYQATATSETTLEIAGAGEGKAV